ncbi:hypothetical protein Cfla_0479 [Cellulomonas flavigena DSM 20109]|uniref:Uncharacterized protein n=1 Tax=Cellulomonas flavigena (strain ATCC 482 / DSM 20109 / BCRC 11376 / JCM 18109 / NBRC 3775 / NCIMB 8073 / NRS 134) TaxID=446466 RepID=D5UHX0_CELFN|nr:hypothetical protein [Cellulomonas flavigena]ADG73394.1 hypothetical protein Cfla_0479 [Cellulomonas flavigena DSM 20109]
MTTNIDKDGHALPQGLRERWRSESVASVWRRPSDWYHPAVDALAVAVLADADPSGAAFDLGRARGEHGVGIGEALDDLVCLYRSTGRAMPPLDAVRALNEGWSDAQADLVVSGACIDAETGLPTQQYLTVRLAEAYLDAEQEDLDPAMLHGLTVVDVAAGHVTGLVRAARSAAVGAALREAFGSGHPMATLGGGVFVVLTRTDDAIEDHVAELRADIERRCADRDVAVTVRRPVRVWVEPLPETHAEAVQRLGHLARPEPWEGIPRPAEPADAAGTDAPSSGGSGRLGAALPPGVLAADLWPYGAAESPARGRHVADEHRPDEPLTGPGRTA